MRLKRPRSGYLRSLLIIVELIIAVTAFWPSHTANAQDDRITKAKQKGKIVWYTGVAPDELRSELVNDFRAKTGLDVSVYYGGSGQIISRLMTERKAGSRAADVVTLADFDLVEGLNKEGMLRSYAASQASSMDAAYRDPSGRWYGFMFWGLSLAYNTKMVPEAMAPNSFADLADPKWKSKIVITDPARSAIGLLMLKAMVAERGWEWVEQLMRNDPLVLPVAPGITQALVTGERILGTGVTPYVSNAIKAGAPIALTNTHEVLLVGPMTASVMAEAPNLEGAQLLVDYLLTQDAGKLVTKYGWFSPRADVQGPHGFPPAKDIRVTYKEVSLSMSRQAILDRYNGIVRSIGK